MFPTHFCNKNKRTIRSVCARDETAIFLPKHRGKNRQKRERISLSLSREYVAHIERNSPIITTAIVHLLLDFYGAPTYCINRNDQSVTPLRHIKVNNSATGDNEAASRKQTNKNEAAVPSRGLRLDS